MSNSLDKRLERELMIDEIITVDGRKWRLVGTEPHTRLDGVRTTLVLWQGHCRHCGKPFVVKSTRRGRGRGSKSFQIRNCPEHRGMRR